MEQATRFVGMDMHKDTIVVAVTATGDVGKAIPYGTVPNTAAELEKLVKRLRQAGSGPLKFCYGRRRRASTAPAATVSTAPSPRWAKLHGRRTVDDPT
jgi:hypothetical protein